MKTRILVIFLLLTVSSLSFAQNFVTDSLSKSKIMKLEFLTGKWKGKSWFIGISEQQNQYDVTQHVQFKIDSTVLQIEKRVELKGVVIQHELDLITYSKLDSTYVFNSFLATGNHGRFTAILKGNRFYWYPFENTGYGITINEKGQWDEVGQIRKGRELKQFFEMILDKVGD